MGNMNENENRIEQYNEAIHSQLSEEDYELHLLESIDMKRRYEEAVLKEKMYVYYNVELYNTVLDKCPKICKRKVAIYNLSNGTNHALDELGIFVHREKVHFYHHEFMNLVELVVGDIRYKAEFDHLYNLVRDKLLFCSKETDKNGNINYIYNDTTIINIRPDLESISFTNQLTLNGYHSSINNTILQIVKDKHFKLPNYKVW